MYVGWFIQRCLKAYERPSDPGLVSYHYTLDSVKQSTYSFVKKSQASLFIVLDFQFQICRFLFLDLTRPGKKYLPAGKP